MILKTCSTCKKELPETEFYVRSRTGARNGRHSKCKSCSSEYMKNLVKTETAEQRSRRLSIGRAWMLSRYGITVADYDRMLAEQGGVCASCAKPATGKGAAATLNVDHDHVTGAVRGLLCNPCNQALGLLRDDPDVIWQLLLYSRKNQRRHLRLVA